MVDNFELIKPLMKFENVGDFYFVEVLQRKKDGNEDAKGNNKNRCVRDFYVYSVEGLDRIKAEAIELAKKCNARVYIRLNKRNYRTIALAFAEEALARVRTNASFGDPRKEFSSVVGRFPESGKENNTWLIDIDDATIGSEKVERIKDIVMSFCLPMRDDKIVAEIPSKSGVHLITHRFDVKTFSEKAAEFGLTSDDIKKDNPTILYVP